MRCQQLTKLDGLKENYRGKVYKRDFITNYFDYLTKLLSSLDTAIVEKIIDAFVTAAEQGDTVYFIGNGGSAATASHFANDLGFGIRAQGIRPFKAISLADNLAVMTALANDEGYDKVFVRQLESHLQKSDVVVAMSVSGNSPNILEAVKYANDLGALTIAFTGFEGGLLKSMADISLHIPTAKGEYGPVEDIFMILDHVIYSYLRLHWRGSL